MREILLVNKLTFGFRGSVAKRALVLGDADNDGRIELVCANLQGDLAIFKDSCQDSYASASELGMVTACLIGDVINSGKNYVSAINTEGWLYIFELTSPGSPSEPDSPNIIDIQDKTSDQYCDTEINKHSISQHSSSDPALSLTYSQRLPANCKELLLADVDGDGKLEIIIGLTDRVVRTYRWVQTGLDRGKFVGIYKWEFADQIGSVSLNESLNNNCTDIIVAQPGGTYAKLECFEKSSKMSESENNCTDPNQPVNEQSVNQEVEQPKSLLDSVKTGYIDKLTPEYHQLSLSQMRNHHVTTEVLGGVRQSKSSDSRNLIALATLDGTLMLANKNEVLWSLQVDHQLFAMALLETRRQRQSLLSQSESTCTIVPNLSLEKNLLNGTHSNRSSLHGGRSLQYFVVCAWDGKTYIVDEDRNYLRFKFDEAVSAFTAGNFYFASRHHSSLVYATFNNQIVIHYDVIVDNVKPIFLLDELLNNPEYSDMCAKLERLARKLASSGDRMTSEYQIHSKESRRPVYLKLIQDILYSVTNEDLMDLSKSRPKPTEEV